jgi:hypothetical protein
MLEATHQNMLYPTGTAPQPWNRGASAGRIDRGGGATSRLAALAILLVLLTGCDSVTWGGTDLQIVPPPPAPGTLEIEPDARVFAELGLPSGTVLFHLVRDTAETRLVPVAEVARDTMRTLRRPAGVSPGAYETRFRQAVLPVGAQFEVYRRGARVGTFVVQDYGAPTRCGLPTAIGNVTTVAAAADQREFLAFRRGLAPEGRGEYTAPQITGSIRTYASIIAERLILQAGLPRPRSWPGAQRDLQAIEIMPGAHPEMSATYLVGDALRVEPADPNGYSVFYMADFETRRGYQPIFSEVRNYSQTGKAAPRLVDHLDWSGNDRQEVLIHVFGEDQSWYEAVGLSDQGQWAKLWQAERC